MSYLVPAFELILRAPARLAGRSSDYMALKRTVWRLLPPGSYTLKGFKRYVVMIPLVTSRGRCSTSQRADHGAKFRAGSASDAGGTTDCSGEIKKKKTITRLSDSSDYQPALDKPKKLHMMF